MSVPRRLIIWRALLDLLFPCECKVCKGPLDAAKWVCKGCLSRITIINPPCCSRCGLPLAPSFLGVSGVVCKECRRRPRYFHQASGAALYEGVMRECIHLFKYERRMALSKPLAGLMVEFIQRHWDNVDLDLLVPVPLHPRRKRERGFNQAEALALVIKESVGLPLDTHNLRRIRFTPSQTTLDRKERLANVRLAFQVRDKRVFVKKKVLLIDDLFTTGATINECSRMLQEAGAKEVYALTLARAV